MTCKTREDAYQGKRNKPHFYIYQDVKGHEVLMAVPKNYQILDLDHLHDIWEHMDEIAGKWVK